MTLAKSEASSGASVSAAEEASDDAAGRGRRLLGARAVPFVLAGCGLVTGPDYEVPAGPRRLDQSTPWERLEYVRRAHVWRPVPTTTLNLLAGPPGDDAFAFDQQVRCDYDLTEPPGGHTPKFICRLSDGDTVKVKYGVDNGEVYAEVAATRLLWALGFGTDRQYPVRVTCRGCPPDPWKDPRPAPGRRRTVTAADWAAAFRRKRDEIVQHRCPS